MRNFNTNITYTYYCLRRGVLYIHFARNLHKPFQHHRMRELEAHHTARRLHAAVTRENRMRRRHLQVAFDLFVARMRHRVDEALRVDLVLQYGCFVPRLVDGRIVVVTELTFGLKIIPHFLIEGI